MTTINSLDDVTPQALLDAVEAGQDTLLVINLCRNGLDPNAVRNHLGQTVLHIACRNGDNAMAETLIGEGADVNAVDHNQETPLFVAQGPAVEVLIEYGATLDHRNANMETPLLVAAREADPSKALELVAAGAQLRARTNDGELPLDLIKMHQPANEAAFRQAIVDRFSTDERESPNKAMHRSNERQERQREERSL